MIFEQKFIAVNKLSINNLSRVLGKKKCWAVSLFNSYIILLLIIYNRKNLCSIFSIGKDRFMLLIHKIFALFSMHRASEKLWMYLKDKFWKALWQNYRKKNIGDLVLNVCIVKINQLCANFATLESIYKLVSCQKVQAFGQSSKIY